MRATRGLTRLLEHARRFFVTRQCRQDKALLHHHRYGARRRYLRIGLLLARDAQLRQGVLRLAGEQSAARLQIVKPPVVARMSRIDQSVRGVKLPFALVNPAVAENERRA